MLKGAPMFTRLTLTTLAATAALTAPASADVFGGIARRAYLHSGLTLSGRVLNPAGTPTAGDTITVAATPLTGGGPATLTATTNRAGRYRLTIPKGPSRLLTIQTGTSTLMVNELVSPSIWLSVRARSRARLHFLGGLIDGNANPQPTVELQDATPDGWRTFAAVEPTATGRHAGRFTYVYRSAPSTIGSSFRFRAVTLPAPAWRPGASRPHAARVRP
jgi:hypothetical protein